MDVVWQHDWLSKWALYSPNKIAVSEHRESGDIHMSYKDLNDRALEIAGVLQLELGIQKGDRIAALCELTIDLVALFFACQKYGIILVPLNYRLSINELSDIISDCNPIVILSDDQFLTNLVELIDIKKVQWKDFSNDSSTQLPDLPEIHENDALFLLYTSGTTGKPKGVIYTHKMAFWNSINTSISLKINTDTHTVNVMPPFHTGGWNVLLLPILHHGGSVILLKKFDAELTLTKLKAYNSTVFMGVPTMLAFMSQTESFKDVTLNSLEYIIVGGESMPVPLIETYAKKGIAIRQGYGMTEVGPNLTSLHQEDAIDKKGSIGRPNFYVKTRIVNESGKDAKSGEIGELWLSGPMTTPGYWKNPTETKHAFSDDGRWFKTGDLVTCDENQYFYIVDRLKNMYISGAENIYPAEIERILLRMAGIESCAVIGVSDSKWGEVGKALIVRNDPTLTENEILKYCETHLAKFKMPKFVLFLDELPKTESGKIDRKKLKTLFS